MAKKKNKGVKKSSRFMNPSTWGVPSLRKPLSDFWSSTYWWGGFQKQPKVAFPDSSRPNKILLAKYLNKVRGTVRLVYGANSRYRVDWAFHGSSNYFDPKNNQIVISAQPLADKTIELEEGERRDIISGVALHEGAHGEYTPASYVDRVTDKPMLFRNILNMVEDGYIEEKIRVRYRGFAGYIDASNNYYRVGCKDEESLNEHVVKVLSAASPFEERMQKFFNLVIQSCFGGIQGEQSPDGAPRTYRRSIDIKSVTSPEVILSDLEELDRVLLQIVNEFRKAEWDNVSFDLRVEIAENINQIILDYLPRDNEELEKLTKVPDNNAENSEEVTVILGALGEAFEGRGITNPIGSKLPVRKPTDAKPGQPWGSVDDEDMSPEEKKINAGYDGGDFIEPIDQNDFRSISNIIESNATEIDITMDTGSNSSGVSDSVVGYAVDMKVVPYAREVWPSYVAKSRKYEGPLRRALQFRSLAKQHTERERMTGKVDGSRLVSLPAYGGNKIFQKKVVVNAPASHVALLIDESGSMAYGKDASARIAAIALTRVLQTTENVSYEVWGHTARSTTGSREVHNSSDERSCGPVPGLDWEGPLLMRYLDSRTNMTDPTVLARIAARSINLDGFALMFVAQNMIKNERAERNILIIICDGLPGTATGYMDGTEETQRHVKKIRALGIEVVCIYVGDEDRSLVSQISYMYGREGYGWVHCPDDSHLPGAVSQLSKKALKWAPNE